MKYDVFDVNFIFMFFLFFVPKISGDPHNYPKEGCPKHSNLFLRAALGNFSISHSGDSIKDVKG